MPTPEELFQAFDDVLSAGVRRGLLHNDAEDEQLDGRLVTVHGRKLVNFGSCSYLGLEMHPALRAGVIEAVHRYGTQFSSSRTYISAPAYVEAEQALSTLFDRPTIITPSTTMGHVATLPTVVGSRDAMILDHQAHHSMHTAARLAQVQGSVIDVLPHSDLNRLSERVEELSANHRKVWYAADGLYSMYADFAPIAGLNDLVERHQKLWLYIDDAHAMSWTGTHGRGYALDRLSPAARARTIVCGSLNKSFAASGGAFTFPDEEMRRRVFTLGGPLIFSGPVQPPMLGAIIASARLHLSPEILVHQRSLLARIRLFNRLAAERGLPLVSPSEAPIRCVGAGTPEVAYNLTARLRAAGYFVDVASFPAVAAKRSGARVALTTHQTEEDIAGLVDALAEALPAALADEGSSVTELRAAFARQLGDRPVDLRPPLRAVGDRSGSARVGRGGTRAVEGRSAGVGLRLEYYNSVRALDRKEWDRLLGDRGAYDWSALSTLESVFPADSPEPENAWKFHYFLVRDAASRPVAATFFTTALWKDDMLSAPAVSAEVERRRESDPYYLSSTVVGMGSLLTEGNHLYLDRSLDWRSALRLILQAARAEEDRAGASAVVLRDLPDGDQEIHPILLGEGFFRIPVFDTWVRPINFTDDESYLASLRKKARYHQRANVLSWEDRYDVQVIAGGSPAARELAGDDRDHLYRLYRNVHARNLHLNVYPLPRRLLDAVLANPGWELTVLRLKDGPAEPVAFGALHIGASHVQPLFVGLDYSYVASHRSYQQTLWQSIRSAQRHGVEKVLFGMSADLQKARFGAVPERRWAYVQTTDSYQADVLAKLIDEVTLAAA
jgi:7-keto-8-aminopelargonate synthetase-like enzyme